MGSPVGPGLPPVGAGREPAAAAIRAWLGDPLRPRLCAVTGSPGAGKSRLVAWVGAADAATDRAVNGMIGARGMTARSMAWALADQLTLPGGEPGEVVARIAADRRPATVIIGELDESGVACDGGGAAEIIKTLLNPVLELQHIRLLVDGRPETVNHFDAPAEVIHLDAPEWTNQAAFMAWLRADQGGAGAMFPNAGLAEIALRCGAGPDVPGRWLAMVSPVARPAIEALASAYEPVDGAMWEAWTTALTGDPTTARQALAAAAPLTVQSEGRYLLARVLRERVLAARQGQLAAQIGNAIGYSLYSGVPKTQNGMPDWSRATPYVLRHLLRHALASGTADRMLADLGCVVHSDPLAVTAVIEAAGDDLTRRLAAAWDAAGPALAATQEPAERAALLRLCALQRRDTALAEGLAPHAARSPWSVRWAAARPADPAAGHWTGPVTALTFGPGEGPAPLLAASADGTLHVLARDGSPIGRIPNSTPALWGLVAFDDGAVMHLDPHGVLELSTRRKAQSRAEEIGSLLNLGDDTATETAVQPGAVHALITAQEAELTALGADREITRLMLGERNGTVQSWLLDDGPPTVVTTKLHDGPVTAVTCLRGPYGGHLVISGGADGAVRFWSPGEAPPPDPADLREGAVTALTAGLADSRPVVVVGWNDGDIHLWDLATGNDAFLRLGFAATALLLEADGTLFVGGAEGIVALTLDFSSLLGPPYEGTE
ncbi:hypothetical protein [Actinomadura rudentiformis]|uniref:Uncharacterized protein n=1 Tax=Actinomadura rudentiformis TaxID=359158 RepID=A0A6H9YU01_9ACTN|nr:hypothetical protein [Actinomadura rudentiformis]KAB2347843.1 hypothetical protein F8566_18290 [Actinomadura rudentiformis]